jgi:ferredoxin
MLVVESPTMYNRVIQKGLDFGRHLQEGIRMEIKKAYAVYFSPTGTTQKAVTALAEGSGLPFEKIDLTLPKTRQAFNHSFDKDEMVVVGLPVYGGRLPKDLEDFFSCLKANHTSAVALVMYGNREYEDALIELKLRLEERGFVVKAGAAFIGEHTFSQNIATGRPDKNDLATAASFGQKAAELISRNTAGILTLKGQFPFVAKGFDPSNPRPYGHFFDIVTTELCTHCGLCAENCPWGAIDADNPGMINSTKCLRCLRCLKNCPNSAKRITDEKFLAFLPKFEMMLNARRREPELFLMQ